MSEHSHILGGSTAERLLQCTASFQAVQMLPAVVEDIPSPYAEYGTALHCVMEQLMRRYVKKTLPDADELIAVVNTFIGQHFHDRILTQEHIDEAIEPALRDLQTIRTAVGGTFTVAAVELRVKFPGVAGAFGTVDLILSSPADTLVIDYKFGAGVAVAAVYTDEHGDILNAQLMFYLAAAMHTNLHLFTRRKLIVAVLQPRAATDTFTCTEVSRKEVSNFIEDVENAVVAALSRDPAFNKGRWCRWCPAKISCPMWTGPLLELIELAGQVAPTPPTREVTPYAQYLARVKTLVDFAVQLKKEIDAQLHAYLENGGTVPGWHLKQKTKMRQWADDAIVQAALRKLGFAPDEIFRRKLVTFESADATARRLGVKIPAELRPTPASTETTLATDDDPDPVVDRALAIEQFQQAYEQLVNADSQ
jgi:RecB family exonuclease